MAVCAVGIAMQSGVIATVEVKSGAYLQASTNSALQPSPSGLTYPFGRLLHLEPDTVQFGGDQGRRRGG